nr:RNA-directed DNA polymerase, eukaryota, reverse transcriptase zinc-binding domain protein [Tanacetum cinerariifolium]
MDDLFTCKLTEEEAFAMIKEVNNDDIKKAMFDIDDVKALGPDGYTTCFFKKAWDKMKPFVKLNIGDGTDLSVWYDKWEDHGPLSKVISDREIYNARFNKGACIADMLKDGKWI